MEAQTCQCGLLMLLILQLQEADVPEVQAHAGAQLIDMRCYTTGCHVKLAFFDLQ